MFFFAAYEGNDQDRAFNVVAGGTPALRAQVEAATGRSLSEVQGAFVSPFRGDFYFGKLRELLAAHGTAVLQVITIDEKRFEHYRRTTDFIQRHVFPGGMLPTKSAIAREADAAGLEVVGHETFGESYARTLEEWRRRFLRAWPALEQLGADQPFRRLWDYYLCYCAAGFRTGAIDVGLYTLRHKAA